jgi:hypothetical protein
MYRRGVGPFKYFVGISSLEEVATREDRVCVLNILGGESSEVTPVSHAYSGGNVVFGTSPGRQGQVLKTPAGNIPVFNSVREGWMPAIASTSAWYTCRLPACATAWPSWCASIPTYARS